MPHDPRPAWPVMGHTFTEADPLVDGDAALTQRIIHEHSAARRNQALGLDENGAQMPGSGPGGVLSKHEARMRLLGWTGV
jgi:hypothetical protein